MPTQRLKEKRVEERASVWERERGVGWGGDRGREEERERQREREKECTHVGERERENALAPPFICFFLPLGLPYVNWA